MWLHVLQTLPPLAVGAQQPVTTDPTLDLCTSYPLRLGGQRQCEIQSLPDTSTHCQHWESNPRPSNALSTWLHVPTNITTDIITNINIDITHNITANTATNIAILPFAGIIKAARSPIMAHRWHDDAQSYMEGSITCTCCLIGAHKGATDKHKGLWNGLIGVCALCSKEEYPKLMGMYMFVLCEHIVKHLLSGIGTLIYSLSPFWGERNNHAWSLWQTNCCSTNLD